MTKLDFFILRDSLLAQSQKLTLVSSLLAYKINLYHDSILYAIA